MKILWFSWKDRSHPQAGGAEIVTDELLKRLARDNHEVILITSHFAGGKKEEERDGYHIYRIGSRVTVYWKAYRLYKKNFQNWADLVIDECNTIPFFSIRYTRCPVIIFFHQLCREVWFYQMPLPLSWVGYLIEPIYLRWLSHAQVVTVSQSTSNDLQQYGFKNKNIKIISEGITIEPVTDLKSVKKYNQPTVLSLGSIRPMKRTMDVLSAFELAKYKIPSLRLIIAGSLNCSYGKKIESAVRVSPFHQDIELVGVISDQKKIDLLLHSHFVAVTSVKEGWCLVVTEANSQGTPAVAYNVDGLRDSIRDRKTGWLTPEATPMSLATTIVSALSNNENYNKIRYQAWLWSREITFAHAYNDFYEILALDKKVLKERK